MSWTQVCTHCTLTTACCRSFQVNRCFLSLSLYQIMFFRKYQYRICRLCNRLRSTSNKSHHRTTDKIYRVLCCNCSGKSDSLLNRCSDWDTYCYRMIYFSNNGHQFVYNRSLLLNGSICIVYGFYVKYSNTLLDRQSTRTHYLACHFIDQNNLVTCRINLVQKPQSNFRICTDYTL